MYVLNFQDVVLEVEFDNEVTKYSMRQVLSLRVRMLALFAASVENCGGWLLTFIGLESYFNSLNVVVVMI